MLTYFVSGHLSINIGHFSKQATEKRFIDSLINVLSYQQTISGFPALNKSESQWFIPWTLWNMVYSSRWVRWSWDSYVNIGEIWIRKV